ncbi:MAG: YihA family ribosome biogenesis GTP-binding protein [Cytophagales bacterium]|nr:MAG: YihA family ribosome biogenesis GTP-binding protein [Cytophagales bacterium]
MQIHQAEFLLSNTDYQKCPTPDKPEYAFIGRSNVGKSSLLNALCNKKVAHTSQQPGKTRYINHYLINQHWYLVDLPGYGWARASKTDRKEWETMIKDYLTQRPNLLCVFLLVDIRHEPQKIDLEFMEWLAEAGVPFVMIFTKADKIAKTKTKYKASQYQQKMKEQWEELPQYFITSSENKVGMDSLLEFIEQINLNFEQKSEN